MSDIELTKDADLLICCIYKSYLDKRKAGQSKYESGRFESQFNKSVKNLKDWQDSDFSNTLCEIGKKGLVKVFIGGTFELTDTGIIYMENRFKRGLIEVTDFISKFIP